MSERNVIAELDRILKPLGFTRQKSTWNRRVGYAVDVIDVQVSKSGDAITTNAGVLDGDVHGKLWGEEPPSFVEESACTVRARIGDLIDGHDLWWRRSQVNVDVEIAATVGRLVLPFLERMHGRQAMEEWLVANQVVRKKYAPAILGLAILKDALGKNQVACEILSELRRGTGGAWRNRFDEVAQRLGCNRDVGA
jgi:hypothetical protein